jgi:hypothetical protein
LCNKTCKLFIIIYEYRFSDIRGDYLVAQPYSVIRSSPKGERGPPFANDIIDFRNLFN